MFINMICRHLFALVCYRGVPSKISDAAPLWRLTQINFPAADADVVASASLAE
jgi:hypothetical protein